MYGSIELCNFNYSVCMVSELKSWVVWVLRSAHSSLPLEPILEPFVLRRENCGISSSHQCATRCSIKTVMGKIGYSWQTGFNWSNLNAIKYKGTMYNKDSKQGMRHLWRHTLGLFKYSFIFLYIIWANIYMWARAKRCAPSQWKKKSTAVNFKITTFK